MMRLTTILLFVLLLLTVIKANAQVTLKEIKDSKTTQNFTGRITTGLSIGELITGGTAVNYYKIKGGYFTCDTLKSILLISFNKSIGLMDGFEVIKTIYSSYHNDTNIEWYYLDDKKKPLSKNINVWMSKPLK